MKKYLIAAFLFGSAFSVYSQFILSSSANVVVNSGSQIVASSVVNNGGTITNSGTISLSGNLTNNTSALLASSSSGTISFDGSSAQEITGDTDAEFYGTLKINNSSGVALTNTSTGSDQTINGTLNFASGKLSLNSFDLTLGSTDPTGVSSAKYIKTNSTGAVKRTVAASDVDFPVGNTAYNPITLNNAGTSDTYGVRVVDNEPANSSTNHMVDRSWVVDETVSGGSDLTVSTQWNSGEELTSFDRTNSAVGLTTDGGSNYTWGASGAASGSDPYTKSGTGFSSVGSFAIGDSYFAGIVVDLQAFLAAAYNTTNDNMDKTLNTAGLLPTTDPYSLNTTVSSVPANAVDWVKIELRDATDNTSVLYSFARFIDQSGKVIEENGSNFKMTGVPSGSYYIAISHRNHFGVMSNSTVDLSNSPSLSFKAAQATAWQDGTISTNAAMKEVETGVFALWDGDANDDGSLVYNGGSSDRVLILDQVGGVGQMSTVITAVYHANDVNMDGNVVYNGGSSDRVEILDNVGGVGQMSTVLNAHLPE